MRQAPDEGSSRPQSQGWVTDDFITAALLHRVLIARTCAILAVLVGVVTFLREPSFTSRATVALPPTGMVTSGLGGVAAQLGLGLGLSNGTRPAAFYISLARSEAMMKALVAHQYSYKVGDSLYYRDLVDLLAQGVEPRAVAVERAAAALSDHVGAALAKEAGTIDITATFDTPELAQAVGSRLLMEIDRFNVRERLQRAADERKFLAERLDSARTAQHEAEEELQSFLEKNRDFHNSPALQVRFEGLNREARLRQDLAASINDSYEKARLEESRRTGVMVVVAEPSLPAERDARFLVVRVLAAMLVGCGIGVSLAWGIEFVKDKRLSGYPEPILSAVREASIQDLRRPWRLLRNPRGTERTGESR